LGYLIVVTMRPPKGGQLIAAMKCFARRSSTVENFIVEEEIS